MFLCGTWARDCDVTHVMQQQPLTFFDAAPGTERAGLQRRSSTVLQRCILHAGCSADCAVSGVHFIKATGTLAAHVRGGWSGSGGGSGVGLLRPVAMEIDRRKR